VRPEDIGVSAAVEGSGAGGRIKQVVVLGSRSRLSVEQGGETIEVELPRREVSGILAPGDLVVVRFRHLRIFPESTAKQASGCQRARALMAVLS
jgi:hypothetical protein